MSDDVNALFETSSSEEEQDTQAGTPHNAQTLCLPIPGLYIVKRWLDEKEQVSEMRMNVIIVRTQNARLPACWHSPIHRISWA